VAGLGNNARLLLAHININAQHLYIFVFAVYIFLGAFLNEHDLSERRKEADQMMSESRRVDSLTADARAALGQ